MYIIGERQKKLSEALDKAPPKAYLEAMAALLKWLQNNKDVLKSEKYEVRELAVMEKQYRQFKVGLVLIYFPNEIEVTRIANTVYPDEMA